MSESEEFTKLQLRFLEVWHLAARWDCLYIIRFYCQDAYGHDNTSKLTDQQRADLADAAERDIFDEAIARGYTPTRTSFGVDPNGYLC